jgi:hypothetical protein
MQNYSKVFKSNFDHNQRAALAHKKDFHIFTQLYFRLVRHFRIYDVTVDFHWPS